MGDARCDIRIGTSGWHYDHWVGRFYPEDLPKDQWLQYYVRHFDTVEINNTFYHLPREQTVVNWRDRAPGHFVYAVKASRYITHVKKLSDPEESVRRFFELVDLLKGRLGPILYQLPPSLHKDLQRLDGFIKVHGLLTVAFLTDKLTKMPDDAAGTLRLLQGARQYVRKLWWWCRQ